MEGESMKKDKISLLCVDDNVSVCEAIRIKVELSGGIEWVGRLEHAGDLVSEVKRLKPDVVLLDIDMPGKDSFEALAEVVEANPDARVLILSGYVQNELIDRAVEAGAWGYISKNEGTEVIVSAIRSVAKGDFVLGPEVEAEASNCQGN